MPDDDPRTRLEPLIGEWTMEVDLPGSVQGTASFAWVLGDRYVLGALRGAPLRGPRQHVPASRPPATPSRSTTTTPAASCASTTCRCATGSGRSSGRSPTSRR